jgi:hypothetical protein
MLQLGMVVQQYTMHLKREAASLTVIVIVVALWRVGGRLGAAGSLGVALADDGAAASQLGCALLGLAGGIAGRRAGLVVIIIIIICGGNHTQYMGFVRSARVHINGR